MSHQRARAQQSLSEGHACCSFAAAEGGLGTAFPRSLRLSPPCCCLQQEAESQSQTPGAAAPSLGTRRHRPALPHGAQGWGKDPWEISPEVRQDHSDIYSPSTLWNLFYQRGCFTPNNSLWGKDSLPRFHPPLPFICEIPSHSPGWQEVRKETPPLPRTPAPTPRFTADGRLGYRRLYLQLFPTSQV